MQIVIIKLEGSVEGAHAFSTREKAEEAINRWERDDYNGLLDSVEGPFQPITKFHADGTLTDPDDSYGGWQYQIVECGEVDSA